MGGWPGNLYSMTLLSWDACHRERPQFCQFDRFHTINYHCAKHVISLLIAKENLWRSSGNGAHVHKGMWLTWFAFRQQSIGHPFNKNCVVTTIKAKSHQHPMKVHEIIIRTDTSWALSIPDSQPLADCWLIKHCCSSIDLCTRQSLDRGAMGDRGAQGNSWRLDWGLSFHSFGFYFMFKPGQVVDDDVQLRR